jgi:hypothetical protein
MYKKGPWVKPKTFCYRLITLLFHGEPLRLLYPSQWVPEYYHRSGLLAQAIQAVSPVGIRFLHIVKSGLLG